MKALTILATLFVTASASAQTTFRRAIDELAQTLSPEGTSGKIAALAETTAGRRALLAVLRECSQWKSRAFDGTGWNDFELHLFTRDEAGMLTPRPDRKAEFEVIRDGIERMSSAFEEFNRRCDSFSARLIGETPLDLQVKKAWQDPSYRRIKFNEFAARYDVGEDPLGRPFAHSLRRDASGALRVEPDRIEEVEDWVDWTRSRVKQGTEAEASFLERVGWLEDAGLTRAFKDSFARSFVVSRMGRANDSDRIQWLLIRYGLLKGEAGAFRKLTKDVEEGRRLLARLSPRLDRIASELGESREIDRKLKTLLGDKAFRGPLIEDILVRTFDSVAPLDRYFDDLMLKGFDPKGAGLLVRAERFNNDDEGEPVDEATLVARTFRNESRWFHARHRRIMDIAERTTDSDSANLFQSPLAIPVIERDVQQHSWALKRAAQEVALPSFRRRYLEGTKPPYTWRADREEQAQAILDRAREIAEDMARKDEDD